MPLIATSELPAFARLRAEGYEVVDGAEAASTQLRIGLLNLMPDAALEATERQFMRLLAAASGPARVLVYPFTVAGLERQGKARSHVQAHYGSLASVADKGLHALIVTGANPANPDLTKEGFWPGMVETLDWARDHVHSTICSCLATHAVVKRYDGIERVKLPQKRWGVYSHRVLSRDHPLTQRINTRFDAPHSHVYEVTRAQLERVGIEVLAESEEAGVHFAVSADGLRFVFFQGHPEYDANSLLKEYKREVARYLREEREDYPRFPEHYFTRAASDILDAHREEVAADRAAGKLPAEFPEDRLKPHLDNTWSDTGKAMFRNWVALLERVAAGAGSPIAPALGARKSA